MNLNENNNEVIIVSCTKHKDPCDTLLYKSLEKISSGGSIYFMNDNKLSLAEAYNKMYNMFKNDYKYILFIHDDVYINCFDFIQQSAQQLEQFNVIGVAGATTCTVKYPPLWHLMSERKDHRGCVGHYIEHTSRYAYTSFGPVNERVLLIDGVFIGVNTESMEDVEENLFDESNTGKWHLYDLDFCLNMNKLHKTIGVVDLPIIHASPGLRSMTDKAFQLSQEWFVEKWAGDNK